MPNHHDHGGARGTFTVFAMVAFTVIAAAVYVALPMIVDAAVRALGVTEQQAGFVAAADMLGACVASILVSIMMSRWRWRRMLVAGIAFLAVFDVLSGLSQSYVALLVYRFAAGIGEGTLLAVGNASISETDKPDRVFGLSVAGQLLFGAAALYSIPWILARFGLQGVFYGFAVVTAVGVPLVRLMPDEARALANNNSSNVRPGRLSAGSLLGLLGVLTYFIAQGGGWAYLDRMGDSRHLAASTVGSVLAVSSIAGLVGAACASWLDTRWGRARPLLASAICSLVSLVVLTRTTGEVPFALMASLFNFAWNFSVPYQFGALGSIDSSRRTVALGGLAIFAGLTIGPSVSALVLANGSFTCVNWTAAFFCVISVAFFMLLFRWGRHNSQAPNSRDLAVE